jgi:uncharacterized protein (TIGR02271 family)
MRVHLQSFLFSLQHNWRASDAAMDRDVIYSRRDRFSNARKERTMATHTVIATYKEYGLAEQVAADLIGAGINQNSIHIISGNGAASTATGNCGREDDEYYSQAMHRGYSVVTVAAENENEAERAAQIMERHSPIELDAPDRATGETNAQPTTGRGVGRDTEPRPDTAPSSNAQQTDGAGRTDAVIPVVQEELVVGKRATQRGGVRIRTRPVETPVQETVELQEERAKVQRRAVDRPAADSDFTAFKEGEIELRETAEEAVVSKRARVVEEVVISKEATSHVETVNDTVHHTEVEVEPVDERPTSPGSEPVRQRAEVAQPSADANRPALYGTVPTRERAEWIVSALRNAGISGSDVSVLLGDKAATRHFAYETNTKAPEGATAGGATGMGIGAVLGWLAGIGSLAIPGVGPFIAAGPIMAALGGAALGGATGGLIGALVGMGIPEREAKVYNDTVRGGGALVSVHTGDAEQQQRAREILATAGAENIHATNELREPA